MSMSIEHLRSIIPPSAWRKYNLSDFPAVPELVDFLPDILSVLESEDKEYQ